MSATSTIDLCCPRVYVGARSSIDRPQDMAGGGITAILNVADNADIPPHAIASYKCARVVLKEHWVMGDHSVLQRGDGRNPPVLIDMAVGVLKQFIDAGEVVLCHCLAGCHRSPGIVALYMIRHLGMDPHAAWNQIQTARGGVRMYTENEFLPQ